MLPFGSAHELDELLEEFIDFQLLSDGEIPSTVWEEASITLDDRVHATYNRLDLFWHHLPTIKSPDGTLCFKRLPDSEVSDGYSTLNCSGRACFPHGKEEHDIF